MVEVDRHAEPLLHRRLGRVEDVERDEAEEVDLEQAHLLDGVHVELRRDFVLVRPVEREELDDRLRRDDDAGRVHPGVARQALEPLGDLDHAGDRLVRRHRLLEARRVAEGALEVDVGAVRARAWRCGRPSATGSDSTRATSRTASLGFSCENVTICDTFSRPYLAVTYSMTSPRRAWQKSMSMSGIEMRSGFRNRSKSRSYLSGSISVMRRAHETIEPAALPRPGADGDALLARVADEVGDDQEVRREAHLLDDGHLVGQALAILLGRNGRRIGRGQLRQAALEPLAREVAEVVGRRRPSGAVKVGRCRPSVSNDTAQRSAIATVFVTASALQDRKPRLHLVGVLDVELVVVEAHPPLVLERLAHADAQQDLVREGVVAAQVVAVVGGDGGSARLGREAQQVGDDRGLLGQAVVHDLHVEVALAEDVLVLEEGLLRRGVIAPGQRPGHLALEASRKSDQPLRVLPQQLLVHARPVVEAREVRLGDEPNEIPVALLRRGQDRQVVRVAFSRLARRLRFLVLAAGRRDVRLDPDDRPDAVLERFVEKVEGAEHVAVVGDRHRRHAELRDALAQLRQLVRAVEQGVLAVKVKVNEVAGHRNPILLSRKMIETRSTMIARRAAFLCSRPLGAARPAAGAAGLAAVARGPRRGLGAAPRTFSSRCTRRCDKGAPALRRVFRGADEEGRRSRARARLCAAHRQPGLPARLPRDREGRRGPRRYPFRANQNQVCFLVNGDPSMIDVDDRSGSRGRAGGQPGLRRPAQALSEAPDVPGHALRRRPRPAGANLKSGGQRFDLDFLLRDGCRACTTVGSRRSPSISTSTASSSRRGRPRPGAALRPAGAAPWHCAALWGPSTRRWSSWAGSSARASSSTPLLVAQRLPSPGLDPRRLGLRRPDRAGRSLRLRRARALFPRREASTSTCARATTRSSAFSSAGPPSS